MRVFVTGASGWIGTPTTKELIKHGHTVIGLARSDASAKKIESLGAQVIRGDLNDTDILKKAAAEADGVIHLGFVHDFTNYAAGIKTDLDAIQAIGEAIQGTGKPFIGTSAVSGFNIQNYDVRQVRTEDFDDSKVEGGRMDGERAVLSIPGIRAAVVRLCPTVHGEGDHGFVPNLIEAARELGYSAYIGEGDNIWPAVHVNDAAALYRIALESAKNGSRLHAVATNIPFKSIAEAIGKKLNVPTKSLTPEEAGAKIGFLGMAAGLWCPASSDLTQKWLDWKPTDKTLLEDLTHDYYFKPQKRTIF
ncbi:NAD-dependent epimerase/dehydratase [Phlyctochytrium arcticum]|nr:NAD-dependent epimerase/dehydratase [Phlyctochytrium arcticum]